MHIIRFIFPFLFVRNWHDGQWELSHARCILFCGALILIMLGIALVAVLQAPVLYNTSTV